MTGQLHYHAKIRVFRSERNFGPGVAELMQLVHQTGSLSSACKQMGMAYSKAWKMIKRAEEDLGFLLMEGSRGGEHGGSTVLTDQGEEFLKRYQTFCVESGKQMDELFAKLFENM